MNYKIIFNIIVLTLVLICFDCKCERINRRATGDESTTQINHNNNTITNSSSINNRFDLEVTFQFKLTFLIYSNFTTNQTELSNVTTSTATTVVQDAILPRKGAAEEEKHSSMAIFFVLSVIGTLTHSISYE